MADWLGQQDEPPRRWVCEEERDTKAEVDNQEGVAFLGTSHSSPVAESRTFKAAVLASGQAVASLSAIIIFAILSRLQSKQEYATYRQTILAFHFAMPLLLLGLPDALYYFLATRGERARGVLKENLFALTAMGVVFSLVLISGGNALLAWRFHNPALAHTLTVLAPYSLFMLPLAAATPCLVARGKVKQAAVLAVVSKLTILASVVVAVLVWGTTSAAIGAHVIGAAIALLPASALMLRATRGTGSTWSVRNIRTQLRYSIPLGLGVMISSIALGFDKVIVSAMRPPADFAVYANGAFEIPLIGVVTGSVTAVLLPELSGLMQLGRSDESLELWKRSAQKTAGILFPAAVFMFLVAPELITLVFSEAYQASAVVFRVYLLLMPIRVVTFMAIIMATGNSRWILFRSFGDLLLNPILCVAMVRLWGYMGAAVASVTTVYLWTVPFSVYVIRREYAKGVRDALPVAVLVKMLGIAVVVTLLPILAFRALELSSVSRLLFGSLLYFSVTLGIYHHFGFYRVRLPWRRSA